MADAIDIANSGEPTFSLMDQAAVPSPSDYEALIADLNLQLTAEKQRAAMAEAALLATAGPQYAGLCQFRAADGRICLSLLANGTIEKGEAFPDDDAASVAFFDSMARNLKGHLNDRENRTIAAEAEAAVHKQRAEQTVADTVTVAELTAAFDRERMELRHQIAVAEAKATALLEARGKS